MSLVTISNAFLYLSYTKMAIMPTTGVSKNFYYVSQRSFDIVSHIVFEIDKHRESSV